MEIVLLVDWFNSIIECLTNCLLLLLNVLFLVQLRSCVLKKVNQKNKIVNVVFSFLPFLFILLFTFL